MASGAWVAPAVVLRGVAKGESGWGCGHGDGHRRRERRPGVSRGWRGFRPGL